MKNKIRIFTYLPNPRIWKALIAADLTKVKLDIRADKPKNLSNWLWDFDARPLKEKPINDNLLIKGTKGFSNVLSKTKKFLTLNPYGNVPVAFNSSGSIGIFESNSILRLVARIGENEINLYGRNNFIKSRIDSFLDTSLVFGCTTQPYLLALSSKKKISKSIILEAEKAYMLYMNGIETSLSLNKTKFIISNQLSIADICLFGEFFQFSIYSKRKPKNSNKNWFDIVKKHKNKYKYTHNLLNKLCKNKTFKKIANNTLKNYKYND